MARKLRGIVAAIAAAAMLAVMPVVAFADEGGGDAEASAGSPNAAGVSMHRLYNPYSYEHFYTANAEERDGLVELGWVYEGIGWTAPETSSAPVYRMYNSYGGEHHYCMDAGERNTLIQAGWTYESIGWYSDDAQGVPLYREYNPYAPANNHNYTADASEHSALIEAGWQDEGYAWYGVAASTDPAPTEATGEEPAQDGSSAEAPSGDTPAAEEPAQDNSAAEDPTPETPAPEDPAKNERHATVKVQGYDEFVIDIDMDNAPITAQNFCKLAEDGYYDGLAFYRIVDEFCLQGGTKGNTASGNDPDLTAIVGEFSANGHDNPLAEDFRKGTVAMARTSVDMNSATSTFFITLATSQNVSNSLNGEYAAFGTIDEAGMQIVDAIVDDYKAYATGVSGAITDSSHMPIIESITIAD